jgi:hypothetical protein
MAANLEFLLKFYSYSMVFAWIYSFNIIFYAFAFVKTWKFKKKLLEIISLLSEAAKTWILYGQCTLPLENWKNSIAIALELGVAVFCLRSFTYFYIEMHFEVRFFSVFFTEGYVKT